MKTSRAEALCRFAMATYGSRLTPKQIREGWTYFSKRGELAGVKIPADGDSPGFRVTVAEMESGQVSLA